MEICEHDEVLRLVSQEGDLALPGAASCASPCSPLPLLAAGKKKFPQKQVFTALLYSEILVIDALQTANSQAEKFVNDIKNKKRH